VDQLRVVVNNRPNFRPQLPQGEGWWVLLRRRCYKIVLWDLSGKMTGRIFDQIVSLMIVLNILNMSLYYWLPPTTLMGSDSAELRDQDALTIHVVLEGFNFFFTWVFIAECGLKLMALGIKQYWSTWWNRVDGFVVALSLVGFAIEAVISAFVEVDMELLRVFRAIRIIRIVRLLKADQAKGCLRLLETLCYTLPSLANVSALLLLVLFIYTTLGMSFFGRLPVNAAEDPVVYAKYPYGMYNDHANFRYFHTGMLTLFRMSTGESWNGIMHDCMTVYPHSWVFFVTYMMIVAYIMFNMLIAVVLEQFAFAMKQDGLPVKPDHIAQFSIEWARFDPECTHTMSSKDLMVLLKRLPQPLGLEKGSSAVVTLSESLHIPTHAGQVHFVETISALIRHVYDLDAEDEALEMSVGLEDFMDTEKERSLPLITISELIAKSFPSILDFEDDNEFLQTYAASKLQASMRGFHARGVTVPAKKAAKAQTATLSAEASKDEPGLDMEQPVKWAEAPSPEAKRKAELETHVTPGPKSTNQVGAAVASMQDIPNGFQEDPDDSSPDCSVENRDNVDKDWEPRPDLDVVVENGSKTVSAEQPNDN